MTAALRREALARAEAMHSPRAAEVLRRSQLQVRDRGGWESSDGTVHGVDVHVLLDGFALGLLDASPLVRDAVVEAITAVAPSAIGASIVELSFAWGLAEQAGAATYRDALDARAHPTNDRDVSRALVAYLAARGDDALVTMVERSGVRMGAHGEVLVSFPPRLVASALDALFGRPVHVRHDPR